LVSSDFAFTSLIRSSLNLDHLSDLASHRRDRLREIERRTLPPVHLRFILPLRLRYLLIASFLPLYRDIDNQGTDDQEVYFYMNSGHEVRLPPLLWMLPRYANGCLPANRSLPNRARTSRSFPLPSSSEADQPAPLSHAVRLLRSRHRRRRNSLA
jgi:hypothetical protein